MTMTATRPQVEHKTLLLSKASIDTNGTLTGYAAIFGNLDDGGDIIEPGFFADVLGDFLREGFISAGHDWNQPIAMPTAAREDAKGLFLTASYHSDAESQRYRTIAAERLEAGLQVGLSIGYEIAPGGATIEKDGRHLRKASRLFEVAQVTVPMNREAEATDVKTLAKSAADNVRTADYILEQVLGLIQAEAEDLDPADPDAGADEVDISTLGMIRDLITNYIAATAPEVGTPADLADAAVEAAEQEAYWSDWGWMGRSSPIAEHADRVMKAVAGFQKRVRHLSQLRLKEGRVLSSSNAERLEGVAGSLAATAAGLKDLLASAATEKRAATPQAIEIAYLETEARLVGVHI